MKAITLRAHFDGEQIRLDEPYALAPDTPMIVTIWPQDEDDKDREGWTALSAAGLSAAYGDDEPDYSQAPIREPNLEYEGG